MPLSISNSSELEELDLGDNNFNGNVRNIFGNLQNLYWINLAHNNFETKGSDGLAFLSSLTNCSHLEVVNLEKGLFGGVLPDYVGNLSTSVSFLALDRNQLYGSIPSTIGNLVNLQTLALNDNLFTGPIPASIGYLQIGLACSTESPKDRMSIDIVLREFHLVKNNILKVSN
ncbi:hypothetical protein RHGRI_009930 [Rhododendron griersonianum]|uniref:Uncharacterized protein n=1 Tax=Rhododendron griersonianum TaxID=479676 RepID=A0AAV6KGL6_9ERIC|nr:hypothetical protein RHGRI_009930 [Rhododendron griersonianum]